MKSKENIVWLRINTIQGKRCCGKKNISVAHLRKVAAALLIVVVSSFIFIYKYNSTG